VPVRAGGADVAVAADAADLCTIKGASFTTDKLPKI